MNHNKVITLKVIKSSNNNFEENFNNVFLSTKEFFNDVVCWGKDSVYTKDGKIDLTKNRQDLYEKTDKSLTYEQFSKMIAYLYEVIIGGQNRAICTSLFSKTKIDKTITGEEFLAMTLPSCKKKTKNEDKEKKKEENKKKTELMYLVANTLRKSGFFNRFPFNSQLITPPERYSVLANTSRMLISWIECDKKTFETYEEEEKYLAKELKDIQEPIKKFYNFCVENSIVKHFDEKMKRYLQDCVIPSLKSGVPIEKHFYYGSEGKKIGYSLSNSLYLYLKENKDLWDIIVEKLHVLEKIAEHDKHKPYAFYPFMDENSAYRVQYNLGTNYVPYDFSKSGETLEDVVVVEKNTRGEKTHNFINGKKADIFSVKFKETEFKVCTREKYHNGEFNPGQYFKDLSIWETSDKANCTNLLEFIRKGEKFKALVKEPAIVKVGKDYNIRLNMTIIDEKDSETAEDLKWYFMSALPSAKKDGDKLEETKKNIDRFERIKGKTFNFLGIDIGMRTPFSWAVGKSTIEGPVNKLEIIAEGEYENNSRDEYRVLNSQLYRLRKFIYNIRCAYNGEEDELDNFGDLINDVKDYFKKYNKGNKLATYKSFIENENLIQDLRNQIKTYEACELKGKYDFIVTIMVKFIKLRFGEIKESRKYHLRSKSIKSKLDQEFNWLKVIEGMKKLSRSVSYLGLGNDRTPTKLIKLSDYFNGCKDNYLKVFVSEIVKIAVKNNCKVIVMEDLGNGSVALNRKRENFIYYLWSPGRIQDAVANAAKWFGISVATVPESQTSQVHFETQKYGYREKTKLYYTEKDVVKSVHADFNAAKNIMLKFVTRNSSMTQVFTKGIYDDNPVNDKERNGQKLQDGLITHKFGSIKSADEFFKKRFPKEKYVYLHGGEWISKSEKNEIQDGIKKRVVE